jgi:hypothetical protein
MRAVRVRVLIVALIFALISALAPLGGAAAQDFPSRPVRFVVPMRPGAAATCWRVFSATSSPASGDNRSWSTIGRALAA